MDMRTGGQTGFKSSLHRKSVERFATRALSVGTRYQDHGISGVFLRLRPLRPDSRDPGLNPTPTDGLDLCDQANLRVTAI